VTTLLSEAVLLIVAAQTGFLDGPRVLANMAVDSWVPRRFAALSERLTTHNGIILMGASATAALLYSHGAVDMLVVMYSINVFLTFSLSMFAMARLVWNTRRERAHWKKRMTLFITGFALCFTILCITVVEKFPEGGWVTLVVTGAVIGLCMVIKRHYGTVFTNLKKLYATLEDLPHTHQGPVAPPDKKATTAAIFVASYGGIGIHTVLNIFTRAFPGHYKNAVFLSVGVVDSGAFKGEAELEALRHGTEANLKQYVKLAEQMGIPATYRMSVGTDAVAEAEQLGREIAREFPRVTFFAGYILFQRERWYQRLLHNETAFAIQRRIQWAGMTMVILPARVQ
jgi:multisubunit Na+/H+ antiporter MnhB subunit